MSSRFQSYIILTCVISIICFIKIFEPLKKMPDSYAFLTSNMFVKRLNNEKMYITSTYTDPGRLGNILFRFASLYGIGQSTNRYPYFNANNSAQIKAYADFADAFPLLAEYIEIKVPNAASIKVVEFSDECCKYEEPLNLKKYDDIKYLTVSANFLHSYKFFHKYQNDIKKLMECSEAFKTNAEQIADEIWRGEANDTHKFCMHVRREDFVANPTLLETEYEFVISATTYIYSKLKEQNNAKISLSIVNNDEAFSRSLKFPDLTFTSINILKNNSAALDMCFASRYCDSLLISASASTYAWWIGYLMENQSNIYYNTKMAKTEEGEKRFFIDDFFLPHWKRLKLFENGTLIQFSSIK